MQIWKIRSEGATHHMTVNPVHQLAEGPDGGTFSIMPIHEIIPISVFPHADATCGHAPGATQSSYERTEPAKAPEKLGFSSSIGNWSSSSSYPNVQPFPACLCHLVLFFFVLPQLVGWVPKCPVIFVERAMIVFGGSAVMEDSVLCCESTSGSREVIGERSFPVPGSLPGSNCRAWRKE